MAWTASLGQTLRVFWHLLLVVLRTVWVPVYWVLRTFLYIILTISAPLLYVLHFFASLCYTPIHFFGKFETLYIYFGVACIVGGIAGVCLYYLSRLLVAILGLDQQPEEEPRGRTAASYRAERALRQAEMAKKNVFLQGLQTRFDRKPIAEHSDGAKNGTWSPSSPVMKKGLLSTTIFEEEDSSGVDFD